MNKNMKALAAAASVVAAVYLFLGFGFGPLVRSIASKKLTEKLHRPTTIERVDFNPFTLKMKIAGFKIAEPDGSGEFLSFKLLQLNFQFSSLFRLAPVAKAVELVEPFCSIVRNQDGAYNFSDLLESGDQSKPTAENNDPARFFFSNITIKDGSLSFDNRPVETKHKVESIELFVPVVSNLPVYVEEFAKPRLSFVVDGSPVRFDGQTKPFAESLETMFDISAKDLNLVHYLGYSPVELGFTPKSAMLNLDLKVNYAQYTNKNPTLTLSGGINLNTLELLDKSGKTFLSAEAVDANVAPSDLLDKKLTIAYLTVKAPYVNVVREKDGELNLTALGRTTPKEGGAEAEPKPADAEGENSSFAVTLQKITVGPGAVDVEDRAVAKPFKTNLSGFTVEGADLDLAKSVIESVRVNFTTEAGETAELTAGGQYSPVEVTGTFALKGLKLPKYKSYYSDSINFDLLSGVLGGDGNFQYGPGETTAVTSAALTLQDLKLAHRESGATFLTLPKLGVKGAEILVDSRQATVEEVSVSGLKVEARRDQEGKISLADLGGPQKPAPTPEAAPEAQPWAWTIKSAKIETSSLLFEDDMVTPQGALKLTSIAAQLTDLKNQAGAQGGLNLKAALNNRGQVSLTGKVGVEKPSINVDVKFNDVDLAPLNPYLTQSFKAALADGTLGLTGKAAYKVLDVGGFSYDFTGSAEFSKLRIIEESTTEDLLRLGSLSLNAIEVHSEPNAATVGSVSITDPYIRIDVDPDGLVNISDLQRKKEDPAKTAVPEPAQPAKAMKMEIGALAIQGGVIDFSDRHITPNYRMKFSELAGRVSRMSSLEEAGGSVELYGSIEGHAPLKMTGNFNPLTKDVLANISVDIKNVELTPFTPYAIRYIGYKIAKGKLALELQYKLTGRKLDSENRIIFDQFTLGEEVPSKEAISVPMGLVLALLTDRNGVIDLDVPISGTLDDPDFSYGRVIWKVIVNILVKAVTSPFKLLGALFGGGSDLSNALFEPGAATLADAETGKLDKLAKALTERPALKLEISAKADPVSDREAMRQDRFQRKLKAAKLREMIKTGQKAVELGQIEITAEERPKVIADAFDADNLPKPAKGSRALTTEEMEKLLLTHTLVTDEELNQLAAKRAQNVFNYLIETGKVDQARVFIVGGKGDKKANEELPERRVDFLLK